ncbi:GGDEF domain-containing protein, partial [uncultured Brachyspira sp.]|uniref:GGDEF domain-containing protein n=1 Tax=uncultured Brachyspira sp. TaxID=221953 RepID=UPI00262AFC41
SKFGNIILNTNKNEDEISILINYLSILLYSEKLSFLANRDKLTGLYNRGYIIKYLEEKEISNEIYSIVIIDLDKFKHYNDTYGHNIGDYVLKLVSKVMKEKLKKLKYKSVLARYGGEEFIIVFDISNKNDLFNTMEMIRNSILETDFSTEEYSLKATASLGGAVKEKNIELKTFINNADQALYNAKKTGRNKSVILDF